MYFSRSFIASALLGFAAATNHETPAIAASETLAHTTSTPAVAPADAHASTSSSSVLVSSPTGLAAHATGKNLAAAGQVATHVIQVGGPNGTLVFAPDNIVAQPGDLVQFQFNPKNHSVVQSTFDQPCVPITNVMPNKTDAFFSGFMPSNATAIAAGNVLTYTIRVMDTKPIWFYCSQGKHCQEKMVGAINPPTSGNRTLEGYKNLAAGATENLSPGQAPGSGAGAAPSSGAGGAQTTAGLAGTATGTTPDSAATASISAPAQQSVNASPDRVSQSFFGLASTLLAAFMLL